MAVWWKYYDSTCYENRNITLSIGLKWRLYIEYQPALSSMFLRCLRVVCRSF